MKYAILSDVHANLHALDAVIADACRMGAETFVSLGDVVGYGPLPAGALARVRATCAIALAGNHDDAVSGRTSYEDFIDLAADAVKRHRDALSSDALAWLKSLPYAAEIEGAVCTHGDLVDPPKFYYIQDEADAAANFNAAEFPLAFVGHTHHPVIFVVGEDGETHRVDAQDFAIEDDKRYIVNVGSVGYPRESDGVCRSSYVIYDSTERTVEFRTLPFAVSSVLQRGGVPKSGLLWRAVALLATCAAFALVAGLWLLPPSQPKDDPALVVDRKTLAVGPETKALHANLKLAKDSEPVSVRLRFFRANNKVLGFFGAPYAMISEQPLTVRKSLTKNLLDANHTMPDGTRLVTLTVLKIKPEDTARIDRFEPTVKDQN